jgi:hypothetical protein
MHGLHRRAILVIVASVFSGVTALARDVGAQPCVADFSPPLNVTLPDGLRTLVGEMLAQSPRFQEQWQTLVTLPQLRLTVHVGPILGPYRAQSIVHRYQYGLIVAVVELPAFGNRIELLAHEFEHVIEQTEGLDLRQLARGRSSGVHDLGYAYETKRAYEAGRRVALECDRHKKSMDTCRTSVGRSETDLRNIDR